MNLQKKKLTNRSLSSRFQSFGNCNGVSVPRLISTFQAITAENSSDLSNFMAICVDGSNDRWIVIVLLFEDNSITGQFCTSHPVSFNTIRNYFIVSKTPYYGYVELFLKK